MVDLEGFSIEYGDASGGNKFLVSTTNFGVRLHTG